MNTSQIARAYAIWLLLGGCGDDLSNGGAPTGGGQPLVGGTGGGAGGDTAAAGGASMGGAGGNGAATTFSCEESSGEAVDIVFADMALSVESPVQVRSPPGRPNTLFIVERTGRIVVIDDGVQLEAPFLDVSSEIRLGAEEGLLGLAFHPGYEENARLFIHYSRAGDGASTVMEYARSTDPNLASSRPVALVMQTPTALPNHNGGAVELGNDGYLYVSIGDGGGANDPECDAQDPDQLLGKVLRIDVDANGSSEGYPAAPGNPGGGRPYHSGLRNPWRMSFDACTGDLYIGDVGQGSFEEVDVATAASGALNFGWPLREGSSPFDNTCPDPSPLLTEPIAEYGHDVGCSITGGVVYRGSAIPALRGWYFFGDYCSGSIFRLRAANGRLTGPVEDTGAKVPSLSAFGHDGNGEIYATSLDGAVYRLEASER